MGLSGRGWLLSLRQEGAVPSLAALCSVHSAALTGLSHPCSPRLSSSCSPRGPCTDTGTPEGHSKQHHGGAQSQC